MPAPVASQRFVEKENGSPSDELINAAINSNKFVHEIKNRIGIENPKPGRRASVK